MPKLFMETEAVANLFQQMRTTVEQLKTNNDQLKSKADSIIPTSWEGGSSVEFTSKLEELLNKYNTKAQEYVDLSNSLEKEMTEWQDAAIKLG